MKHLILLTLVFCTLRVYPQPAPADPETQKALELYEQAEAVANNKQMDHAGYISLAKEALPLLKKTAQWDPYCWTLVGLMNSYYYISDFAQSLQYAQQLENDLPEIPVPASFYFDKLLRLSVYYAKRIDHPEAIRLMEAASAMAGREGFNRASVFNNLGYLHRVRGDYQQAFAYYERSITERKAAEQVNYSHLANTQNNIAAYYQELGMYDQAAIYFRNGLESLSRATEQDLIPDYRAANELGQGINYQKQGQYEKAHACFSRVLTTPGILDNYYAEAKHYMGVNYQQQGKVDKALEWLKEALQQTKKLHDRHHTSIAEACRAIGEVYQGKRDYDQSLAYYQQGIAALVKGFDAQSAPEINPSPDLETISKTALLPIISGKAAVLRAAGRLEASLTCYELAAELVYAIRREIFSFESKLYLSSKATGIYEQGIGLAYDLYQQTQEQQYLEKAFGFCEKNKATLLLEGILEAEARGASKIPKALREEVEGLKMERALYRKALTEMDQQEKPDEYRRIKDRQFLADATLEKLYGQLESDYPDYYQLRYALHTPTLEEVGRKVLSRNECFIEYFAGEEKIFLFSIGRQGRRFQAIEHTKALQQQLENFLQYFSDRNQIISDPAGFYKLSHQIFGTLLQAVADPAALPESMWIIPDGVLSYLPFDALITQPVSEMTALPHYLLETSVLKLAYSAAFLLKPDHPDHLPGDQLLAVAPGFQGREQGLAPLPYSIREVESLSYKRKTSLLGEAASLAAFRRLAPDFSHLHLSTHARAESDDQAPRIYFIDSVLYLQELYAMQLNTDLLVLSGCQTNLGALARGEGVLSLARGFSQAGARRLISSLWEIRDKATAEILQQFYYHLSTGVEQAAALRQAKLDFLNRSDQPAYALSPYFWASLVYISNRAPTPASSSGYSFSFFLSALLALAGILFFFSRRARK